MTKKIWFKRKLYGYGWYPSTWQGWLITLFYLGAILSFTFILGERFIIEHTLLYMSLIIVSALSLVWICYLHGEEPRWQWGKRKN